MLVGIRSYLIPLLLVKWVCVVASVQAGNFMSYLQHESFLDHNSHTLAGTQWLQQVISLLDN